MNFRIGDVSVGSDQPCFIVAEMSGNHGGNFDRAIEIVRAAAESGANALKLQTYTADTITLNSDAPDFEIPSGPWESHQRMWDLYNVAHTPWDWHEPIYTEARRLGLEVFSSPFDESAVDFLESLGTTAYKIASPEINHIPLLKRVAKTGKPVILSSGLASLSDIELALSTLRTNGAKDIALLKCTTAYPAPFNEMDLLTIPDMAQRFELISGLSDHSMGTAVAVAAAALGAKIIEKHFTLDVDEATVDSFFSNDRKEFATLVADVRTVEQALGRISYDISPSASVNLRGKRSLYISAPVIAGETLSSKNVRCVRPSFGLHPKHYDDIIGRVVKRDLSVGDRIQLEDLK